MIHDRQRQAEITEFTSGDRAALLVHRAAMPRLHVPALTKLMLDSTVTSTTRDDAIWAAVHGGFTVSTAIIGVAGATVDLACHDPSKRLRKSAAWALMKLGRLDDLARTIDTESDADVGAWKLHLPVRLHHAARGGGRGRVP